MARKSAPRIGRHFRFPETLESRAVLAATFSPVAELIGPEPVAVLMDTSHPNVVSTDALALPADDHAAVNVLVPITTKVRPFFAEKAWRAERATITPLSLSIDIDRGPRVDANFSERGLLQWQRGGLLHVHGTSPSANFLSSRPATGIQDVSPDTSLSPNALNSSDDFRPQSEPIDSSFDDGAFIDDPIQPLGSLNRPGEFETANPPTLAPLSGSSTILESVSPSPSILPSMRPSLPELTSDASAMNRPATLQTATPSLESGLSIREPMGSPLEDQSELAPAEETKPVYDRTHDVVVGIDIAQVLLVRRPVGPTAKEFYAAQDSSDGYEHASAAHVDAVLADAAAADDEAASPTMSAVRFQLGRIRPTVEIDTQRETNEPRPAADARVNDQSFPTGRRLANERDSHHYAVALVERVGFDTGAVDATDGWSTALATPTAASDEIRESSFMSTLWLTWNRICDGLSSHQVLAKGMAMIPALLSSIWISRMLEGTPEGTQPSHARKDLQRAPREADGN